MSRRSRLSIGLAAAAALTLALPVGAEAQRDRQAPGLEQRDKAEAVDVELVAASFKWDVEATTAHLAAQQQFGGLVNTLSTKYADSFAGAAFAREPGAPSQVMIKGKADDAIRRLVEGSGLKIELVDGLRYSETEQQQRSVKVVRSLGGLGNAEVVAAVLPEGVIQVSVSGDVKTAEALPDELRDGVEFVQGPERLVRDEVVEGGRRVYNSATGGSCTSGFSVRSLASGVTGVATAGHCNGINRFDRVGADVALTHQAEHIGLFGDVEWKTSADVELAQFWASPTAVRPVDVVWPAGGYATNMITCVHSRMNGRRSCDRIYSTSVSSTVGGVTASNLIATDNDNTSPGDSGSNWSFGTIADGIHRGDKWIWFGTRNVFSKAGLMPSALNVEVMTS